MHQNHNNAPNIVHAGSIYLSTYGTHLRDVDQPIITNLLQTFFHRTENPLFLGRLPHTSTIKNPTPFNIHGDKAIHITFTHRNSLHNSLTKVVVTLITHPVYITSDHSHLLHMYTFNEITTTLT